MLIVLGVIVYLVIGLMLSEEGDSIVAKISTVLLWPVPGLIALWLIAVAAQQH